MVSRVRRSLSIFRLNIFDFLIDFYIHHLFSFSLSKLFSLDFFFNFDFNLNNGHLKPVINLNDTTSHNQLRAVVNT